MNIQELKQEFIKRFGESSESLRVYFAPGRVNLIGEHTDYNGGYVFPCALSYGTYMVLRPNGKKEISFQTANFDFKATVSFDKLSEKQGDAWINYPLGVIAEFRKKGVEPIGFEALYYGNIPNGAGLSSSASVELVTGVALDDLLKTNWDRVELVKIGQKAENLFVGVNCGIMDQFASGMGKKDCAILLDCNTLQYELVPVVLKDCKIVIANTNKRRGLADSKYNERRSQCEKAVELISKKRKINTLGELTNDEFESLKSTIEDEVIVRRAKHAVTENQRTKDAVKYLKSGDIVTFGQLMNASHDSLQHDYEVTGIELDTLVDEARKIKGTIGARMTGAGFGGCTVSIVKTEAVDTFVAQVGKNYEARTGLKADFYIADIGDGASRLE